MRNFLFISFILLSSILACKNDKKANEVNETKDTLIIESNTTDTIVANPTETLEERNAKTVVEETETKIVKSEKAPEVKREVVEKKEIKKTETTVVIEPKISDPLKKEEEKTTEPKPIPTKVEEEKVVVVVKDEPKIAANNWIVPENFKQLKNPVSADLKEGKALYEQHCKSCHGSKGLGDGPKAKNMKGDLGDFSSVKFQSQTDGELFYKTKFGRADMPNFKKLYDDDIWLVVHYMRSLKK